MSIFSLGFLGVFAAGIAAAAGIPAMTDAVERGDLDEASRLGVLAGPGVVEQALTSPTRQTQLAGVVAATAVEARAELLPALATLAGSGDRRAAIPAAHAARTIARELARSAAIDELSDEVASDEVATWRALFDALVKNGNRFIEVRVLALDTVASLALVLQHPALGYAASDAIGFDLAGALVDPDPALRAVAVALVPRPTPDAARAPLASAVKNDADDALALAAAQVLCGDDRQPALSLLGAHGLDRIKKLVAGKPARATRDARQCLLK